MGDATIPEPVLLILAAFSRHDVALDWARRRSEEELGAIELESQRFEFRETGYYEPTMGPGLRKMFLAFAQLGSPAALVELKLATNHWEQEYAARAGHAEPRPLNLDPGYLTPAKLVLASTKDHAHRMYLDRGIYAEVTLNYRHHAWQPHEWTFPDYRRADYQAFFSQCRQYLRGRLKDPDRGKEAL